MIYRSKNRELLQKTAASPTPKAIESPELGFGNRPSVRGQRLVNQDGAFNIIRVGEEKNVLNNAFHQILSMEWGRFFGMILIGFLVTNIIFAVIYFNLGVENLQGMIGTSFLDQFSEAFFFSTQTLTTLGYGRISPVGFATSFVASIESMLGLLAFAMATGLLYGRFSHPEANIIYSKNALFAPYRDGVGLMVRMANGRRNQLIELEALVTLARNEIIDGVNKRKFYVLPLEITKVSVLASSWTLVHPVIEGSPFFGMTFDDINESDGEILVQIKAYDETYSQNVYSRSSFMDDEIIVGGKFISAVTVDEQGRSVLDLSMISDYEIVEVPIARSA